MKSSSVDDAALKVASVKSSAMRGSEFEQGRVSSGSMSNDVHREKL